MPATRGLLGDYLRLLDRHRVVNQVLRIDPEAARMLVDNVAEAVVGDPGEPIAGLPSDMHPLLPALDRARTTLEEAVVSSGRDFPGPVLVALFPTGAFNAQTRITEHGYLVLLNGGLLDLLRRLAKTSVASTSIGEAPPKLMPQDALNAIGSALWQYLERPHHPAPLAADLDRYGLFGADSSVATRGERLVPEDVERVAALVNESAVRFVAAHELAHIMDGHVTTERQRPVSTDSGSVELARKRIDEEFEADAHGLFMHLAAAEPSIDAANYDEEKILRYVITFAGPLLFFTAHSLLSHLQERLPEAFHGLTGTDHPSSDDRRSRLSAIAEAELESLDAGSVLLNAHALDLEEKLLLNEEPLLAELERQWQLSRPRGDGAPNQAP